MNFKRKIAKLKILRKISEAKGHIRNDSSKCVYCGLCEKVCPVEAISVFKEDPKSWNIEHNVCMRCTRCVSVCPKKSLALLRSS
ncbi:4Fe-4S dicluster domain-containing protein [Clostridium sp. YIM B02505]|uniref:4Fe-4S dicluster domain-containing protein n=1 Tax=Clostridium yunnanense TaxID=2800325 RepID=A0ABS1ELB6_9CLOT|nr:4Fe-4S dicluster domain-containing protein [Clostridium yunnanense]MBK1810154.1 4Fe-4S dicluster domain-containing protein [Clostridium yunnanense]